MYDPTPFDRNIRKQRWFRKMKAEHKMFLVWLFFDMDSIGVVDPDVEAFADHFKDLFGPSDIDLDSFVHDCNNDGKERMMPVDRARKLWFTPTVIFKNSHKSGFRKLSANERDKSIIKHLAQREVTRDWTIEQLIYNERLTIDTKLILKVYSHKDTSGHVRDFVQKLADTIGYKIPDVKTLPERLKSEYHYTCQYCGELFEEFDLHIDHIVPVSKNGPDTHWNMVPACMNCNSARKLDKNVFVFMEESGLEYPKDWEKGLLDNVDKLARKGLLEYPTRYLVKKNKKKKYFTYTEVVNIHTTRS